MDNLTLAYIAGILDADGYFTIKRSTYGMRVTGDCVNPVFSELVGLKQVSPEAVDLIHGAFGGYRHIDKPNTPNGKPLHVVQLTNKGAATITAAVLPFLRIKHRQAEILLELRATKDTPCKVADEPRQQKGRWGTMTIRRKINSPAILNRRAALLAEIRSLNDTRPTQPFLG